MTDVDLCICRRNFICGYFKDRWEKQLNTQLMFSLGKIFFLILLNRLNFANLVAELV